MDNKMKYLILTAFLLSGCAAAEQIIVQIDNQVDNAKDKAITVILEERRDLESRLKAYIEFLEKEQIESTERLERLRNELSDD